MPDITKIPHKIIEDPPLNVVLFQPEIPSNTGNIARMCGAAMVRLHLIHPLGFSVDDKHLKRAGLDYWYEVDVRHHMNFTEFLNSDENIEKRLVVLTKFAELNYTEAEINPGTHLLFGRETKGLPLEIRKKYPCYKIPVWGNVRSLNLSTSAGIVVYHSLNRLGVF